MKAPGNTATRRRNIIRCSIRAGRISALVLSLLFLCACVPGSQTPPETGAAPPATLEPSQTAKAAPVFQPTAAQPLPTFTIIGQVVCTAKQFVNIRDTASADAPVIGTFPAGETAEVLAYSGRWAHVSYGGILGYVHREYIIEKSAPDVDVPTGEWAAVLVNPSHVLPGDFSVALADFEGGKVDARILEICRQMFADAKEDGVSLRLVDAYRSYDRQNELYQQKVQSYIAKGYGRTDAETKAATITARPNTSEHQTGLALDIVTPSYTSRDKGFANTKAFQWLNANAHNYGFTLRYKEDKASITKVIYEPWHWRFVGVLAATDMRKSGQCYEEYLGKAD